MKKRTGFVSNSSSSSFIISSSKKASELSVKLKFGLSEVIEQEIRTQEEAEKYLLNWWYIKDNTLEDMFASWPWARELYDKMIAKLDDGETIYVGRVSNEGDPVEYALYENGFPEKVEGFEVLQGVQE